MNVPANHVRRKTTGEVRPYELAASFFAPAKPQRALPAAKSAVRLLADPENQPESPGTRSKGAAIWGIPAYMFTHSFRMFEANLDVAVGGVVGHGRLSKEHRIDAARRAGWIAARGANGHE